jgi:hypothetical protein
MELKIVLKGYTSYSSQKGATIFCPARKTTHLPLPRPDSRPSHVRYHTGGFRFSTISAKAEVPARGIQAGDARVKFIRTSDQIPAPTTSEESTHVY